MNYRSDIDGLRAYAVLVVILFHVGVPGFSGGFVGVDVFFVISGYLITTLTYTQIKAGTFTISGFYKKRIARLFPALALTLLVVTAFGFVFYNNQAFDNLGKEIFFSSFGAANLLFSNGVNYFANDEAYQPLLHLWSLGVEEQFYVFWPFTLLLLYRYIPTCLTVSVVVLFLISLLLSIAAVDNSETAAYFLPQYRAFELLMGAILSLVDSRLTGLTTNKKIREMLSLCGVAIITLSVALLNEGSNFPGVNALFPCIGAALIILAKKSTISAVLFANKTAVFIGLISYPLYLYHQPIISFLRFFDFGFGALEVLFITLATAVPLSWITYKYVENPIRKIAHSSRKKVSMATISSLSLAALVFGALGLGIAKSNGFSDRFRILNSFAFDVSQANSGTFDKTFARGVHIADGKAGKVLFVGDSVMQHYVVPISLSLGISFADVDTATRGGCVFLKGAVFKDAFSDVPCNGLREQLYLQPKKYDFIFISQQWEAYGDSVMNFDQTPDPALRWRSLLGNTINYYSGLGKKVVIIGWHPNVEGTSKTQASIFAEKQVFKEHLNQLNVTNVNDMLKFNSFFESAARMDNVYAIEPYKIFCENGCATNDGEWPYFSDSQHISSAATEIVAGQFELLSPGYLDHPYGTRLKGLSGVLDTKL